MTQTLEARGNPDFAGLFHGLAKRWSRFRHRRGVPEGRAIGWGDSYGQVQVLAQQAPLAKAASGRYPRLHALPVRALGPAPGEHATEVRVALPQRTVHGRTLFVRQEWIERPDIELAPALEVVPVGRVVIEALAAYLAACPHDGPLFVDELGDPLTYRRWRTVAEAAARSAGVDLTAHALRHFYASALIAGGASVKQVQERLGHATAVITLEVYGHLWPGDDDRTRDVMDAVLSPLADSLRTAEASDG